MEKYGIENLKKAGEGVLKTFDIAGDVLADGKVNIADIGKVMELPGLIGTFAGLEDVDDELLDLSSDEALELKSHFKTVALSLNADIEDDKLELLAEKVLTIAVNIAEAVSLFTKKAA